MGEEGEIQEYVWFEEWQGMAGIDAHGGTSHGVAFHNVVDKLIEEEWSFWRTPVAWPHASEDRAAACFPGSLPADLCDGRRQSHQVSLTHALLPGEAERASFLQAMGNVVAEARSSPRNVWFIVLEGLDNPSKVSILGEWESATPRGFLHNEIDETEEAIKETLESHGARAGPNAAAALRFGGPLWPEG